MSLVIRICWIESTYNRDLTSLFFAIHCLAQSDMKDIVGALCIVIYKLFFLVSRDLGMLCIYSVKMGISHSAVSQLI